MQRFDDAESVAIILTLHRTVHARMHDVVDFERLFRGAWQGLHKQGGGQRENLASALAQGFRILLGCVQYFERLWRFGRSSRGH